MHQNAALPLALLESHFQNLYLNDVWIVIAMCLQLYGAVTMNNVLCLSVFLALVYARGLTWDFSSEVLVIVIVCIVMGLFASFRTSFPLWTAIMAILLYPFSLALVYVLDYVFGWS